MGHIPEGGLEDMKTQGERPCEALSQPIRHLIQFPIGMLNNNSPILMDEFQYVWKHGVIQLQDTP